MAHNGTEQSIVVDAQRRILVIQTCEQEYYTSEVDTRERGESWQKLARNTANVEVMIFAEMMSGLKRGRPIACCSGCRGRERYLDDRYSEGEISLQATCLKLLNHHHHHHSYYSKDINCYERQRQQQQLESRSPAACLCSKTCSTCSLQPLSRIVFSHHPQHCPTHSILSPVLCT